jgi:hypothetical protein
VSERHSFDFAVVRVVPRVDRGEFINAGVILHSRTGRFLDCRVELDRERLKALAPTIDCDVVESYLDAIRQVCKGGGEAGSIAALSQSERFHWLVAPRSTIIQTSPVHSGVDADPRAALDRLFNKLVAE